MRARLRVGMVVLALVLGLTVAGAPPGGAAERRSLQRVDLEVVEQGYSPIDQSVIWAAVVKNTSKTLTANDVTVTATITDASGAVVYEKVARISTILPGRRTATASGGPTTGPGAAKLTVTARADGGFRLAGKAGAVTATGVKTGTAENGERTVVTGTLVSNLRAKVRSPEAILVFRDAKGKIVGGYLGYAEVTIPKRGKAAFEVSTYLALPGYDKVQVYVNLPYGVEPLR